MRELEWIPVTKESPHFPCVVCDINHNIPYVPSALMRINDVWIDMRMLDLATGNNSMYGFGEDLTGESALKVIDEIYEIAKANRITAWIPIPNGYIEEVDK